MSAREHLSPVQFGEDDGLDGPLGSYGEPAQAPWQNIGVVPYVGSGDI